jgi:hypothetical protein
LKINIRSYERVLPVAILLLVFLTGCVTTKAKHNISDEEGLRERVASYWDYKIKGDLEKSYGYEDPLYRKSVNLVGYISSINSSAAKWRAAEIETIKKTGDMADINLKLRVEIILPQIDSRRKLQLNVQTTDKWVKVDGVWYHQPSRGGLRR